MFSYFKTIFLTSVSSSKMYMFQKYIVRWIIIHSIIALFTAVLLKKWHGPKVMPSLFVFNRL